MLPWPDLTTAEWEEALAALHAEPRAAASSTTPLHHAADTHVPKLVVALRYAFARGRSAYRRMQDVETTVAAMTEALEAVLPQTLRRVLVAGGEVGAAMLTRYLRAAGGPGSGNFGHAGRPGQEGGSASGGSLTPAEKYIRNEREEDLKSGRYEKLVANVTKKGEPYEIHGTPTGSYTVRLTRDLSEIGVANLVDLHPEGDRGWLTTLGPGDYFTSVRIDKDYQRQGIATVLYDTVEKHIGKPLRPSPTYRTPEAEGFWRKRKEPRTAGGAGSGNFGHAGRPGQEGGSASSGRDPVRRLARLKTLLPVTDVPRRTALLMPDGTRLAFDTNAPLGGHESMLGQYGYTVQGVLNLGVVRYVPHVGVEVGTRVSEIQAQIVADDFLEFGHQNFVVDVRKLNSSEVTTKVFEVPVSPDTLRTYINTRTLRPITDHRALAKKPISIDMAFDAVNPNVVDWSQRHSADLVTQITETTRQRLREAITDLTLTGHRADAMERILDAVGDEDRAELIARHETMLAASEGQRQAWGQAVGKGLLTGRERRVWIVTDDEKLCPECQALDGETASLNGEYPGGYDGPPAHVQCRCTEGITG